jgi:hypothetical protein
MSLRLFNDGSAQRRARALSPVRNAAAGVLESSDRITALVLDVATQLLHADSDCDLNALMETVRARQHLTKER